MLNKILGVLVVAVAALAGLIALQPSDYSVERTATMAAPPATVFAHVNDLRKWDGWSPWAKLDPKAKVAFEGAPEGQGAVFKWAGNVDVGEGSMTVTDSRPGEHVGIDVAFIKPFEGRSRSEFDLKAQGEATAVTWRMSGKHDFIGKAMCLFLDGETMLGGEIDKGLASLKAAVEGAAKP